MSGVTVFRNARIHTMDRYRPRADALAVRAGRLLAVGTEADVAAAAGRAARIVDLEGGTVMPGFVRIRFLSSAWASARPGRSSRKIVHR